MGKTYGAEGIKTKGGYTFTKQSIYKTLHNRTYLGEIHHKGPYFPGQHSPIITAEPWDAVHALLARDAPEPKRVVKNLDAGLLRGLLFTADGERLVPGYTSKNGKRYRCYVSEGRRRYGAWSSRHGALPAAPLEELVTQQIVLALLALLALQAPHFVQAVVDRVRQAHPDIDEPEIVLPMRNLATMWRTLYPAEQRRLAQLLIERVVLAENGLEILWRDIGWRELAANLLPGSIGAELQELEAGGA